MLLLAGEQLHWARRSVYALLAAVRPDAVALVDAFGYDDYLLNSALGRKDGDVYRCCLPRAVRCCGLHLNPNGDQTGHTACKFAKRPNDALPTDVSQAMRRALLEMAKESPLNDTEEGPAWRDVLAPRMAPQAKL